MNKIITVNLSTQKRGRWAFFGGKGARSPGQITSFMNGSRTIGVDISIRREDGATANVRVQFATIEDLRGFIKELQDRESSYQEPTLVESGLILKS